MYSLEMFEGVFGGGGGEGHLEDLVDGGTLEAGGRPDNLEERRGAGGMWRGCHGVRMGGSVRPPVPWGM